MITTPDRPQRRLPARAGEQPRSRKNLGERILVPYPVESQRFGIERHEDRMGNGRTFAVPAGRHIGTGRRLQLTSRTPRARRPLPRC